MVNCEGTYMALNPCEIRGDENDSDGFGVGKQICESTNINEKKLADYQNATQNEPDGIENQSSKLADIPDQCDGHHNLVHIQTNGQNVLYILKQRANLVILEKMKCIKCKQIFYNVNNNIESCFT